MKILQFRMKIFISTLYLISGPVFCSDVFGYSEGSVLLFSDLQWDVNNTRYICRVEQSGCSNIMKDQTKSRLVNSGRFVMYSNVDGEFLALIRELNPQDSAVYKFGVGNEKYKDIEMTVQNDVCCGGIKKMKVYPGETATFKCNYPDEIKTKSKRLTNLYDQTTVKKIINTGKESQKQQKDRFSIFDDRRSKVFSMNISDVRGDDGGVYLCGAWRKEKSVRYYSYFREIQLQVTGSSVIITVCVCVALLVIGGAALIVYKLRNHMIQDSASTGQRTDKNNQGDGVYENVPHGNRYDVSMGPVYQSLNPNLKLSDLVYEDPDPKTNQPDSDYEKTDDNTNQSDFIYENVNINSSG